MREKSSLFLTTAGRGDWGGGGGGGGGGDSDGRIEKKKMRVSEMRENSSL